MDIFVTYVYTDVICVCKLVSLSYNTYNYVCKFDYTDVTCVYSVDILSFCCVFTPIIELILSLTNYTADYTVLIFVCNIVSLAFLSVVSVYKDDWTVFIFVCKVVSLAFLSIVSVCNAD